MKRREYLATVASSSLIATSGCSRADELVDRIGDSDSVGDTQSFEGIEFTPTQYLLTDTMTRNFGMNSNDIDASQGATFMFTHLSGVHNGDSEQKFPQVDTTSDIRLYHRGDRVRSSMMDDAAQSHTVDGVTLIAYGTALREQDANSGVYPGTEVKGWVVHEIASNSEPENFELRVTWNNEFMMEGEETQKWTYTENSEVSIEDIEQEDTTIEI